MKELNVALIGHGFMGRAHSHAWRNANLFLESEIRPVLKLACGRDPIALRAFADHWGWQEVETDWRQVVGREDIDIIDLSTPPAPHRDIAVAAAKHHKHIFAEKPIALNAAQAREMYEAAHAAGITHYLNHNYRRVPAVALARRLVDDGKIGDILHWRSAYLNSRWMDPNSPMTWSLRKETAGSGVTAGLHSHTIDLARYLVGEIKTVSATLKTFEKERPSAAGDPAGAGDITMEAVTVEDASFVIAEFENGALGSFEASSHALGRRNYNYFELYGSKGSVLFNQERMNELEFFSGEDPEYARGFRTILVTERAHPYLTAWWPPGHILGYEHTFHHAVADFLNAIARSEPVSPNFYDGWKETEVHDAILESASSGQRVHLQS